MTSRTLPIGGGRPPGCGLLGFFFFMNKTSSGLPAGRGGGRGGGGLEGPPVEGPGGPGGRTFCAPGPGGAGVRDDSPG